MHKLRYMLVVFICTLFASRANALLFERAESYAKADLAVWVVSDVKQADLVIYLSRGTEQTQQDLDKVRPWLETAFAWQDFTGRHDVEYLQYLLDNPKSVWSVYFLQRDSMFADIKVAIIRDPSEIVAKTGWRTRKHFLKDAHMGDRGNLVVDIGGKNQYNADFFATIVTENHKRLLKKYPGYAQPLAEGNLIRYDIY